LVTAARRTGSRVLDVNLKGPFLCCQHGILAIARTGGGSVVLLGPCSGAIGCAGLRGVLRVEGRGWPNWEAGRESSTRPTGARHVVSPSATTPASSRGSPARSDDPERISDVAANTPISRLGTGAEVAANRRVPCAPERRRVH